MKNLIIFTATLLAVSCSSPATEQQSSSHENLNEKSTIDEGGVSFLNLEDGATISSPFNLEMGIEGMIVEPKGTPRDGYGHHHLLINDNFAPAGTVIVADDTHIHYGGGQTSDSVVLEPGTHKLTLQFADGMHVSYGKDWSKTITVNVE